METITPAIEVGQTLLNGGTVLQSGPNDRGMAYVLAIWRGEFVTWGVSSDTLEAFWGHYCGQDLGAALEDFHRRVNK